MSLSSPSAPPLSPDPHHATGEGFASRGAAKPIGATGEGAVELIRTAHRQERSCWRRRHSAWPADLDSWPPRLDPRMSRPHCAIVHTAAAAPRSPPPPRSHLASSPRRNSSPYACTNAVAPHLYITPPV